MSDFIDDGIFSSVDKSEDFTFAAHTTYGLGGKAKVAYFPKTEEEACAVYSRLTQSGEKFVILGNGSDVLASDKYFDGAVICTSALDGITLNGSTLYCQSGVSVSELLKFCLKNDVGGLEYLSAIPATMGGIAFMNGGINERHIGDDIISVKVFDGKLRNISKNECNFANKHSTMRDIKCMILGLNLSISAVPREIIVQNIRYFTRKRINQPRGKSCGCVFKNPEGMHAGKLIDECNLKGLAVGDAKVSEKHANFIINNGGSSNDVYQLIREVKRRVFEKCGVLLEEELIYIGEFDDTDS